MQKDTVKSFHRVTLQNFVYRGKIITLSDPLLAIMDFSGKIEKSLISSAKIPIKMFFLQS